MLRRSCPRNRYATRKWAKRGQNRSAFPRFTDQTTPRATGLLRRPASRIATPGNGRGGERQAAQAFAWRRQSHKIAAPHRLAQCRVAKSKTVVPEDPTAVSALIELLELAGRSMHSIGYADGLYPAQWTALRYFSKASDGARTASALARFQGFANGPV